MEKLLIVTLIITLLAGFSQEQDLLPPGPLNKEAGGSVLFTTILLSETITAIRWLFNGREVIRYSNPGGASVNSSYQGRVTLNYSSGALELKRLTMADSGQYTLTLTFDSGLGKQDHTSLQVFERVLDVGITGPMGNLIEDSNVTFTCKANGTIGTTLWIKEDKILAPSSRITFLDNNRTMMLNPLKRSDNGYYQCNVSNPVSYDTSSYNIIVNYGPDVRILGSQSFEAGTDIILLCAPDSVPAATVAWTVKGVSAGNEPLYVAENSKPSNSGVYNCTCRNSITGITASAINTVTVRAYSRLPPGAETGIVLGVICGIGILGVSIFFLVKHLKRPANTEREGPVQMNTNQETRRTSSTRSVEQRGQHIYQNPWSSSATDSDYDN